jgi:hypothetical protein
MPATQPRDKRTLWMRLRDYHFDDLVPPHLTDRVRAAFGGADPSTRAFAAKLARKLDLDPEFALRAIEDTRSSCFSGWCATSTSRRPR